MKHEEITDRIIKAFYKVYNTLGYGFLEKVYLNAIAIELIEMGMLVEKQKQIKVYYFGKLIGEYFGDIIVDDLIILELKALDCLLIEHENQLINYLKATDKEVGLLLNFGKKPEIRRKIFDNDKKTMLRYPNKKEFAFENINCHHK